MPRKDKLANLDMDLTQLIFWELFEVQIFSVWKSEKETLLL